MYKIGYVQGETKQQLGSNAANYLGLALDSNDDPNIGRKVVFKTQTCLNERNVHTIIGRQRAWGYDADGKYAMIDAYRGVVDDNDFGRPIHLYEVEFVD